MNYWRVLTVILMSQSETECNNADQTVSVDSPHLCYIKIIETNWRNFYFDLSSPGDFTWTYRYVYQHAIQFYDQVYVELWNPV